MLIDLHLNCTKGKSELQRNATIDGARPRAFRPGPGAPEVGQWHRAYSQLTGGPEAWSGGCSSGLTGADRGWPGLTGDREVRSEWRFLLQDTGELPSHDPMSHPVFNQGQEIRDVRWCSRWNDEEIGICRGVGGGWRGCKVHGII